MSVTIEQQKIELATLRKQEKKLDESSMAVSSIEEDHFDKYTQQTNMSNLDYTQEDEQVEVHKAKEDLDISNLISNCFC